jgi:hypothetical protein
MEGVTVGARPLGALDRRRQGAALDLAAALGTATGSAADWRRWRWPIRLALLTVVVNLAGMNIEWMRLKREAATVRTSMQQTFKAAYPNEAPVFGLEAEQMRRNIAAAKLQGGQASMDDFTSMSAALGEALGGLAGRGVVASLEYRERSLIVKLKPDMVDASAQAQVRDGLAARKLDLNETAPGVWKISRPREEKHECSSQQDRAPRWWEQRRPQRFWAARTQQERKLLPSAAWWRLALVYAVFSSRRWTGRIELQRACPSCARTRPSCRRWRARRASWRARRPCRWPP